MLILGLFVLVFLSGISGNRINGIIFNRIALLILLYSFILSIGTLDVSILGSGIGVYGGLYQITVINKIMENFLYLVAGLILWNVNSSTIKEKKSTEYSMIALFSLIGGILLIFSNDLISMYLSIELQSFGLYILATIFRNSQAATYAGLKYFLLGGLSSGFILLGSGIVYSYSGITNLESIYLLISEYNVTRLEENYISYMQIGIIIMISGFFFKIAAAPFHNWAPDVYDGVPVNVTTWLAVMGKITILIFLLELIYGTINNTTTNLILVVAILSLLIGTIVGLAQSRIKRLLAYSTISHVGFLLIAIGINTVDSIESFIFYIIQYSLTSANGFFVLIAFGQLSLLTRRNLSLDEINDYNIEKEYSPIQFIKQLTGKFNDIQPFPLLALSMSIILLSMAGIPPLIGFFAKQAVLLSALKNGYIFITIIGIITSVISAGYYLRIIKVMIFDENKNIEESEMIISNKSTTGIIRLSNEISFSISILTILTIFFVLKPTLILNSAHIMALSLFYI